MREEKKKEEKKDDPSSLPEVRLHAAVAQVAALGAGLASGDAAVAAIHLADRHRGVT